MKLVGIETDIDRLRYQRDRIVKEHVITVQQKFKFLIREFTANDFHRGLHTGKITREETENINIEELCIRLQGKSIDKS